MGYSQWSHSEDKKAFVLSAGTVTVDRAPAGVYQYGSTNEHVPWLRISELRTDDIIPFEHGLSKSILNEIATFWTKAEKYHKLRVSHKRGILMHGPAGCGKTVIVAQAMKEHVLRDGLVLHMANPRGYMKWIKSYREAEPNRPLLVVMEDFGEMANNNEHEFLEILDGSTNVADGTLFLGTTNYLEAIPKRLRCRPSRIDTILEITFPEPKLREEYLEVLLRNYHDKPISKKDMAIWVKSTNKFSLAMLKELVISVVVFDRDVQDAATLIRKMSGVELDDHKSDSHDSDDE